MHTVQCGYCGKHVAEKPILGTLHFCKTEAERRMIDHTRWQIRQQKIMIERGVGGYLFGLSPAACREAYHPA